jgi:4-hydroxy-3-methylbut-2-enyl diphosphate reductase
VLALLEDPPDVMVVVGGYNSSNTMSLAAMCAERVPTFHIEDAACIDADAGTIRHQPIGAKAEAVTPAWLARSGPVRVGLTAGASTPNNKIGETVSRILRTRGIDPAGLA